MLFNLFSYSETISVKKWKHNFKVIIVPLLYKIKNVVAQFAWAFRKAAYLGMELKYFTFSIIIKKVYFLQVERPLD